MALCGLWEMDASTKLGAGTMKPPHLVRKLEENKKWHGNKITPIKRRCLGIKQSGADCTIEFFDPVYRLCESCRNGAKEMASGEYGVHV